MNNLFSFLARLRLEAAAEAKQAPERFQPFEHICRTFQLNAFERHCLFLAFHYEVTPELAAHLKRINKSSAPPTVVLALDSFRSLSLDSDSSSEDSFWANLHMDAPLFRYLLQSESYGELPLSEQPLRLETRILAFLTAPYASPSGLESWSRTLYPTEELPPLYLWQPQLRRLLAACQEASGLERRPLFALSGAQGIGKKHLLAHLAHELNLPITFASLQGLNNIQALRRLEREVLIFGALLALTDYTPEDDDLLARLLPLLTTYPYPLFLTAEGHLPSTLNGNPGLTYFLIPLPFDELLAQAKRDLPTLWQNFAQPYPLDPTLSLQELSGKFHFTPGQILGAWQKANDLRIWREKPYIDEELLHHGCYSQTIHNLGRKATRIQPVYAWDDLILPPESKNLLAEAIAQAKNHYLVLQHWGFQEKLAYGRGLSLLFTGPPGTGKTMAAQVVARELKMQLYRVDMAEAVSKYVGETEKNLKEIFEEAGKANVILFFDEADSVFGKRTEVKDAHDRYANLEASFLLQKIEEHEGITILATNFMQNIDEAFKRRLKYIIPFHLPDARHRALLWQSSFPTAAPVAPDIDFTALADQFELTGSQIKNIALQAAFLGAQRGTVALDDIIQALRHESAKAGKLMLAEDLGEFRFQ